MAGRQDFTQVITLKSIEVYPIRAEGGVSPSMALGVMPTRPALLVRVTDNYGCYGWGEVWANFPPRANLHKAHLIEDVVAVHLKDHTFTAPQEVDAYLRQKLSTYFLHIGQQQVFEHILAGLDMALWDLALRSADISFVEFMGLQSNKAASYASSINPPDLQTLLTQHAGYGQQQFKLKIGFDAEKDYAFLCEAAAIQAVGTRLMVDSNQSWTLQQAESRLHAMEEFDLLFAEEPIRADAPYSEWEELAKSTSIPLAGGENIYGVDTFLRMAEAGLLYLQPDVAKWGGVSGALALAAQLPDGVMLWPHFMGTAVGQIAALSVAAAVGADSVCEMDVNANVLRTELCGDVLAIDSGCVALPTSPGLVVPPVVNRLGEYIELS